MLAMVLLMVVVSVDTLHGCFNNADGCGFGGSSDVASDDILRQCWWLY